MLFQAKRNTLSLRIVLIMISSAVHIKQLLSCRDGTYIKKPFQKLKCSDTQRINECRSGSLSTSLMKLSPNMGDYVRYYSFSRNNGLFLSSTELPLFISVNIAPLFHYNDCSNVASLSRHFEGNSLRVSCTLYWYNYMIARILLSFFLYYRLFCWSLISFRSGKPAIRRSNVDRYIETSHISTKVE